MSWVRYDDNQPEHPKVVALGVHEPLAGWLNHRVIAWCCAHHTDGHFSPEVLARQAGSLHLSSYRIGGKAVSTDALAYRLVAVGLWERTEAGYFVHDFLEYQTSRVEAQARRVRETERKRHWRDTQRRSRRGPTGMDAVVPLGPSRTGDVAETPSRPGPVQNKNYPHTRTPTESTTLLAPGGGR